MNTKKNERTHFDQLLSVIMNSLHSALVQFCVWALHKYKFMDLKHYYFILMRYFTVVLLSSKSECKKKRTKFKFILNCCYKKQRNTLNTFDVSQTKMNQSSNELNSVDWFLFVFCQSVIRRNVRKCSKWEDLLDQLRTDKRAIE